MNRTDALKVLAVAAEADNGCSACVSGCIGTAVLQWPAFDWASLMSANSDEWPTEWSDGEHALEILGKVLNPPTPKAPPWGDNVKWGAVKMYNV